MKKIACIIVLLFSFLLKGQQNLVPNYSFEQYSICPSGLGALQNDTPWFQPNLSGCSSDAYNACYNGTNPNFGVPKNFSYQYPRTGNGYAGINLFQDTTGSWPDYGREYIEVGLSDSLSSGKKYCIRLFTVKGNYSIWAIKQIQAVLTKGILQYTDNNYGYISGVTPVLESPNIITDTLNWIPVQAFYTATGGESYLTIGNFSPGNSVNHQMVLPYNNVPNTLGYYLFDDVSVYEQPEVFAGNDTTICAWHSIQLGKPGRAGIQYTWIPSTGLSNPTIANPIAILQNSTTYTLIVTDTSQWACNSQLYDTVTINVGGCVGIENVETVIIKTNVFPNPCAGSATFSFPYEGNYLLRVFDVTGKLIDTRNYSGKQFLYENEKLPEGFYFYEIQNEKKRIAKGKFLIEY